MALPTLTAHQEGAVSAVKKWYGPRTLEPFYLGGLAGTGKSTCLPAFIDALGLDPATVAFCAPTGKAAKVMTTKLKDHGIFQTATTIHKRIYRPRPLRADVLEGQLRNAQTERQGLIDEHDHRFEGRIKELTDTIRLLEKDLDKALDNTDGPKFQLNPDSAIRSMELIVIDEASMVGTSIADDLKYFEIPILCMGDPGQLPPVGEPPGLTAGDPDYFLTEIHRQALDNPILRLATMAREGKTLKVGRYSGARDDEWAEVVERINDSATYDLTRDAQILVGTNRKRWMVTRKLREKMGYRSTGPHAGEPLIVVKNSRKHLDLVNGTFVYCAEDVGDLKKGHVSLSLKIEDETGEIRTVTANQGKFEENHEMKAGFATGSKFAVYKSRSNDEQLDFGHAITTHKAQGSQFDEVILHDESSVFGEDAEKHLYTGITRAAKRLTVII